MKRVYLFGALSLGACTHPEDRRWAALIPTLAGANADHPKVTVYSFATPEEARPPMRLRDLTAEGQAAYIAQMSVADDPSSLRKKLAAPITSEQGLGPTILPTFDRTLVVSVQKPLGAGVGDRLISTVVTIVPVENAFEFAGYTVVATDNQVQDIAKLSTTSDASLDVSVAPPIKALGDVGISGKASRSHTTTADIVQQYEKLNVDIEPKTMTIIRESERGLDVVGNTIINLAIVPKQPANGALVTQVFVAIGQDLVAKGALRSAKAASIDLEDTYLSQQCALEASVTMRYLLRHVVSGSQYYTEGKQTVMLIDGTTNPAIHTLIRKDETQPPLWQIVAANGHGLSVKPVLGTPHILVFDNYASAQQFAGWLDKNRAGRIGKEGVLFQVDGGAITSKPSVMPYAVECA